MIPLLETLDMWPRAYTTRDKWDHIPWLRSGEHLKFLRRDDDRRLKRKLYVELLVVSWPYLGRCLEDWVSERKVEKEFHKTGRLRSTERCWTRKQKLDLWDSNKPNSKRDDTEPLTRILHSPPLIYPEERQKKEGS